VLSFLLISIDHNHAHLSRIRSTLSVLVYPVQYVVNLPFVLAADFAEGLRARVHLVTENERLHDENRLLAARTQRYEALEQENRRLRKLLDSSTALDHEVVVADVLAVETSPTAREIVLNKGTNHGVYVGQPMLDAAGVIGQVSRVGPFSSTGLLITDTRHALPVMLNRSGLRAIAVGGDKPDELALSFVALNADIKQGDLVVTSGLERRFPSGYPVGRVRSVGVHTGDAFATVIVEPSAKVGHTREVLLIGPRPMQELGEDRLSSVAR